MSYIFLIIYIIAVFYFQDS